MRTLPPLHLLHSPLVLVIAQVRISTVLQMSEYVPQIQERLRREAFPVFRTSQTQEIVFGPDKPVMSRRERWLFSNKEMQRTVILTPNFVALAASVYTVFDDFAETLRTVLSVVGSATQVALSERLGLRYVNVIRLAEGESFSQYLHAGLGGVPPSDLGANTVLQQVQIHADTGMGTLAVRLWQKDDGTFMPPDLKDEVVKATITLSSKETVTVLDIDHISVRSRDFDADHLVEDMWQLHDGSDRAFRAIATDFARTRWGAETGRT
jgi:uncharacterized protein (TIGR04255 family)